MDEFTKYFVMGAFAITSFSIIIGALLITLKFLWVLFIDTWNDINSLY